MARVSFTLRNTTTASDNTGGSYVRYDPDVYNAASTGASPGVWLYDDPFGTRDYDSALRADGYALPPNDITSGFFEVNPVSYGVVNIQFGVPITLDSGGSPVIGASPTAYEAVVVYSPNHLPVAVSDGTELARSSVSYDEDYSGLPEGRWAYFSLFVRYRSFSDDYYLKYASLEVLVPRNYESVKLLWDRLPEHVRSQDSLLGTAALPSGNIVLSTGDTISTSDIGYAPPGGIYGPLFRYLSVFGFELDRHRTLLDYLMVAKDPSEANTISLDMLSIMMGLNITSDMINSGRIRNLLESWSYLLGYRGTEIGLSQYARALANSEVEIDSVNHTLTVFSQRVNYCYDPATGEDALSNAPTWRVAHEVEAVLPKYWQGSYDVSGYPSTLPEPLSVSAYEPSMFWSASAGGSFGSISASAGESIIYYRDSLGSDAFGLRPESFIDSRYTNASITRTGTIYTNTGANDSTGITHVWIRFPSPVPVRLGDRVYVRAEGSTGSDRVVGGRLTSVDGDVVGVGNLVLIDGRPVAEITASETATVDSWTLCYAEVLVDLSGGASYDAENVIIERNYMGKFFDGNTTTGTWVIDTDGVTTDRDYRWDTRSAYASSGIGISIYTEEFLKTRAILSASLPGWVPVTEDSYDFSPATTVYDGIPGLDEIDAYYTP